MAEIPTDHGDAETWIEQAARDRDAGARRLSQPGREGNARRARHAAAAAEGCAGQPADAGEVAGGSGSNPLTARVAVNRYWQMYFGTGIVKTAEDFGSQGDPPSHPELLDWLATEFVRTGWDVKAMQRLIVTSATYRQSSRVTPELLEQDPENRLLARGPRFRLPAEMVRDSALCRERPAERKDRRAQRVDPYQPKGLWEEIAFGDGFSAQTYVTGPRRGSLSPQHVHLLEAHQPAAGADHLRCARSREVHGAPHRDQHAAAGAGAVERSDLSSRRRARWRSA